MRMDKRKTIAAFLMAPLIAAVLFAISVLPVSASAPPDSVVWIQKPNATDYAPNGVPDFDQKQNGWKNPWPPYVGNWSWCGPVAVANSLWWWDSYIDGGKHNFTTIEDHFPLVQNYGPWDDHDPRNVAPLIQHLARLMKTDNKTCGTYVDDMQRGISLYLEEKGLNMSFEERTWYCNYTWEDVAREFLKCEDIILLLGFYEKNETGQWNRIGGHYVTVAGIGNDTAVLGGQPWVKLSDPCLDWAETMGWDGKYVRPPHASHSGNPLLHNDAQYVSHDPYIVALGPGPTGLPHIHFGLPGYPLYEYYGIIWNHGLAANGPVDAPYVPGPQGNFYTGVDDVVVFSPIQYDKPAYPDYAPSKMPDFDQKQDAWTDPYGRWSWCGPVAVANSLWWLDSKFDNGTSPDGYPLVQNYGPWDDHDVRNVGPFISRLATLMKTDTTTNGTYIYDMEAGIRDYLGEKGLNKTFYERTWYCNFTFANIEYEVERSEDVILLLGFYEWRSLWIPFPEPGYFLIWWERIGGHYVTVSGVNANGTIKFSDPALDWAEMGNPGEVLPGPHPPGHASSLHNDTRFVSHDYYNVTYKVPSFPPLPSIHWGIESNITAGTGYPWWELYNIAPNGNASAYQGGTVFVGVEYAVIVSPLHDVAITDVTPAKTVVGQGYKCKINVTAENQGGFQESFNVTVYYQNTTGDYLIGTQTGITLTAGASINLTFTWDTKLGVQRNWNLTGYTIFANATVVPGETETGDNTYTDGTVKVVIPGNFNADNQVNVLDLGKMGVHWGPAGKPYNANVDINCNGEINVVDLGILGVWWLEYE